MSIFNVLRRNFGNKSRTRKPDDTVPCPEGYRGVLLHDTSLCTVCGTCSYMCSPRAITQDREEEGGQWMYDAGCCTYCGRCVEYCPTQALHFENRMGPIAASRGAQITVHFVEYQHCERCGANLIPLPTETLLRLYRDPQGAAQVADMNRLCERCRSRKTSEQFKASMLGEKKK